MWHVVIGDHILVGPIKWGMKGPCTCNGWLSMFIIKTLYMRECLCWLLFIIVVIMSLVLNYYVGISHGCSGLHQILNPYNYIRYWWFGFNPTLTLTSREHHLALVVEMRSFFTVRRNWWINLCWNQNEPTKGIRSIKSII